MDRELTGFEFCDVSQLRGRLELGTWRRAESALAAMRPARCPSGPWSVLSRWQVPHRQEKDRP